MSCKVGDAVAKGSRGAGGVTPPLSGAWTRTKGELGPAAAGLAATRLA